MQCHQTSFTLSTAGRGPLRLTARVAECVRDSGIHTGLCHVFCQHTSASLLITENADPAVLRDLEGHLTRAVPDGDPRYTHDQEGPDDMSAHIRSILTGSGLTVPIRQGRLALGTWQGLFLWEHRAQGHARTLVVTCFGTAAS
ncbi:YjbQ family protein [Thiohalocapsa marina]|uniref:YjbQ family protein n=1 Tax=Thiohalocapsa marina TaxID=424902 RepID=A0A5M8FVW3_9GAMM|nr:secondary thiamine-phosphate synthase enzyme YjbQ [Thiohalocapsa marina]KAA6187903.1 YjbQ family protein [Thiohalocapsa marina]